MTSTGTYIYYVNKFVVENTGHVMKMSRNFKISILCKAIFSYFAFGC